MNAPPRLARMMLRVQQYDVLVKYVPGKEIPLADALSRVTPCPGDEIRGINVTVHEMHTYLASPTRLSQVREETARDVEMASLRDVISEGWPDERAKCPPHLLKYWTYRDELGIEDGIIMKSAKIMIPPSLRPAIREQIHYGHQGIEKCHLRAKASVF